MQTDENALHGKRIVLTRAAEQSKSLVAELTWRGARVTLLACVEFRPPEDLAPLDAALSHLPEFDWLVFTSQNAVRFFSRRLRELGHTLPDSTTLRIAALGDATARAATSEKLHVDFVATGARSGSEFVGEFSRQARGKKILLPQSDQATPTVADGLKEVGASVSVVVAYRTCMPESLDAEELSGVRREAADVFVFASPSAFWNFARIVGESDLERFAQGSAFAAIGPTTAHAIRDAGFSVEIEAAKPNPNEVVKAVIEYFSKVKTVRVSR